MKNPHKISRILHILAICTFLTPFFFTGCEENKSDSPKNVDSLATQEAVDTITSPLKPDSALSNETPEKSNGDSDTLAGIMSQKYPFLKPVLVSKKDTFSGLAIVIDTVQHLPYFSIVISLFLLLFSLILKFLPRPDKKTILIHLILALTCLCISQPIAFNCKILWGFWLSIGMVSLTILYDLYSFRKKE